jgi:sigma-B regulation protein RsbU (phosphoserine phosphatase)
MAVASPLPARRPQDAPPATRLRVLVADDRDDVRLALRLLLEAHGHSCSEAASPREVRSALVGGAHDVLLLDLNYTRDTTSGAEGLELLVELRRTHPDLPVVAMTAWGSIELAVAAMREGARDFVLKPWDDATLVGTVERQGRSARPRELDLAGQVQARFRPPGPTLGRLEYAGACCEAGAVGGDAFDVLDLGPGHAALVVGDATGRGMTGALLIAYLQACLRSQGRRALSDLPGLLSDVNGVFHESTAPEHYATLFLGAWDDASGVLRYVNCAHPAPFLLRASGEAERLRPTAWALGLFEDARPQEAEVRLGPGDLLLAFTDGLVEAQRGEEEFGEERLLATLRREREKPPHDIAAGLLAAVSAWTDGEADDRAVLVARAKE